MLPVSLPQDRGLALVAARPGRVVRPVQLTEPDGIPVVRSSPADPANPATSTGTLGPHPRPARPYRRPAVRPTTRTLLLLLLLVLEPQLLAGAASEAEVIGIIVIIVEAATATAAAATAGATALAANTTDEAVEDGELGLELDAVDAGLEGALEVEEAGGLDAEEHGVQDDDQHVRVDQVAQDLVGIAARRRR